MDLQGYFKEFHDKIKISNSKQDDLREKRDILLNILRNTEDIPRFEEFDQGSYAMYLGVNPVGDGREYDIDVALRFNVNNDDYEPLEIKESIHDALKDHTEYGAIIKKPCVTVTYKKSGSTEYHVDLVAYSYAVKDDHNSQMYIALGKEDKVIWEKADPVGLVDYINNKITDTTDRKQFRRVVKYLKRWKHLKFSSNGHGEPPSIGITLIAVESFDPSDNDDLQALLNTVRHIQSQFSYREYDRDNNRYLYQISYPLPWDLQFESGHNVFEKMSIKQMTTFKEKIDKLVDDLQIVQDEPDLVKQCKKLRDIFGDSFSVPEAKDVSKTQINYVPRSTASGARR